MAGVLLFGGSFDPIHHGHLIVSRAAAERLGVSRVILIPSAQPPHKKRTDMATAPDRLEMCRLAVDGDPLFEVSDWELRQSGPSYTLHTVQHFRSALPGECLYWLIGMDSLRELHTWYRVAEVVELCTMVTVGRRGHEPMNLEHLRGVVADERLDEIRRHILDTPLIEISSTEIRARRRMRQSVRYFVPERVAEHINSRELYP